MKKRELKLFVSGIYFLHIGDSLGWARKLGELLNPENNWHEFFIKRR